MPDESPAAAVGFCGRSVPIASAEQALYYVKAGISSLGFDPDDSDEGWQGFIEEHGLAGAYLISAQSALEEALQRAR